MANRFSPGKGGTQQSTNDRIANTVDALSPAAVYAVQTAANITAGAGGVLCCSPRVAGQNLVVPEANGSNFNSTITVMVQAALGQLRIRAVRGLINGAAAYTLAAGATTLIILRSNGSTGWVSGQSASFPIAGNGLEYDGETLNSIGSTSELLLTGITGAQGTVDISALQHGGAVRVSAPTGDWSISGFTAKPEGFTFTFTVNASTFRGTLLYDVTSPATERLRMTNASDIDGEEIQATIQYRQTRWRVVAADGTDIVQTSSASGAVNDLALTPRTTIVRFSTNVAIAVSGFTGGWNGRRLRVAFLNNSGTATLVHNALSAATNQLAMPGSVDFGPISRPGAEFYYDGTSSIWRSVATNTPIGGGGGGGLTQDQILNRVAFRA